MTVCWLLGPEQILNNLCYDLTPLMFVGQMRGSAQQSSYVNTVHFPVEHERL